MALLAVALGMSATAANAATTKIQNTATVSYSFVDKPQAVITLQSNTVVTPVLPAPTPAQLKFLRYDPDAQQTEQIPIDGGQCRADSGSFVPLPGVVGSDGKPLDSSEAEADIAPGYYIGEPVIVSIADTNRNADPAAREYVDVDITTTTGDAETLRLQETGADTGVFAGAIQSVATPPQAVQYDCALSLAAHAQITARYTDTDFPLDALAVAAASYAPLVTRTVLRLEQSVSKEIVEVGDFLQYTLVVRDIHDAPAINVRVSDVLPRGLSYRRGSLRIGNATTSDPDVTPASASHGMVPLASRVSAGMVAVADPEMSADGLSFEFPVGDLAPGASVTATFVAEVGPGAAGQQHLLNFAVAAANNALVSNETDTVVRMREALSTTRFTLIGRVLRADSCDAPAGGLPGVAGVRVLLEDGTFVRTDDNGAYHIEGVRPGTHVAQVDPVTIPAGMQAIACQRNTRHAGRADSQFVEGQGGSLQRADFYLRMDKVPTSEVGLQLHAASAGAHLHYTVDLDGGDIPVQKLRAMLQLPDGAKYVRGSSRVDGVVLADPQWTGGVGIYDLGDPGVRWRRSLEFDVDPGTCAPSAGAAKAVGMFQSGGKSVQTPMAELARSCDAPPGPASGARVAATVTAAAGDPAASPFYEQQKARVAILSDLAAGGGDVDWTKGLAPGRDWVFPATGHNPRNPNTRVVVKYLPGDRANLTVNGEAVSPLKFEGTFTNGTGTAAVGIWRAVPLREGDNLLRAEIVDGAGKTVATLERKIHYANTPARVELVSEQSILVADGIHKPVIAVRVVDSQGFPVRAGVTGEYALSSPYQPASAASLRQAQQIGGMASAATPHWTIEGDDGIAYIELDPTGVAGSVTLGFDIGDRDANKSRQEIKTWLKSAPRDWVVVGFAKGSIGYEALAENMQALQPGEDGTGVRADGQLALYAKGRVLGKWLMTMAYDSDKPTDRLRDKSLLSTIDPGRYYTLYGDGTQQGYDASSARKLYLKLERDQFYALFGDFQTGLDRNELSRYQRTLNGLKVEYRGPLVEFNGFAAKTGQAYARDEIQGDGTSGLYRLRKGPIVLNSERIRIETRDRYHSEQILQTKDLVRHIDYDIDYDNGTLFFREPVASRDIDFNPTWIVAEYELAGNGEQFVNGGGRVGIHAMGGRLEAGASYIRDEDSEVRSELAGVDAKFHLTPRDELRAEAARTRGESDDGDSSGNAWLLEWEHRGERANLLAYVRRQGPGFGLGQQNGYESGMAKTGVQGQYRLTSNFTLQGEAYRQENLASGGVRDAAHVDVAYSGHGWGATGGLQWARDRGAEGKVAQSQQVTLGAKKDFMDGRLELGAKLDASLPGKNESVDFPTRLQLTAAYRINEAFRILGAQEFTHGKDRDTSTTRVGFEAKPWKDATLTSTLNQSQISEYGPRTFALMGLDQKFALNEHWSLDLAVDSSQAFNQSGDQPLVIDPSQPIQAGGLRDGGALTGNFVAVSGGATYRSALWLWNGRAEARQSDDSDRYGFTTSFLRQVKDGVALAATARAFSQQNADGSTGILADAQLSWAWRPLGSEWSMLDKLEFHLDELRSGTGGSVLGQATFAGAGDARSVRLVNNFVMNYASDAWRADDGTGSVFDLYQRSQLSLYYGSKYVIDTYGDDDYAGYTDIVGAEWRFDLTPRIDVGLRASVLHSWSQKTIAWAFGPSIGFTPFTNAWVSVGYNIRGFNDRDFESSHYTAEGAYLVFRMKFDQHSLGLDRADAAAAP